MNIMKVTIDISDDLFRYLTFLERERLITSKEQTLSTALEFYKEASMHDWLPFIYRMGGGRVLIMDIGSLIDLFHTLTNREIYEAAKLTALKRKVINPLFKGVELSNPDNWPLVLRELEIMGWGKFTKVRNEIKIELCEIPTPYLMGYFEVMFKTKFRLYPTKLPNVTILLGDALSQNE